MSAVSGHVFEAELALRRIACLADSRGPLTAGRWAVRQPVNCVWKEQQSSACGKPDQSMRKRRDDLLMDVYAICRMSGHQGVHSREPYPPWASGFFTSQPDALQFLNS